MANIFSRQICLKFFSPTPKPPPPRVINEEETGSEYTLVGVHVNSVGYTLGSLVVAGVFIICTYLCVKKCLSSCFSPCLACKSWTTCSGCCKTQEKDDAAGEDIYEEVEVAPTLATSPGNSFENPLQRPNYPRRPPSETGTLRSAPPPAPKKQHTAVGKSFQGARKHFHQPQREVVITRGSPNRGARTRTINYADGSVVNTITRRGRLGSKVVTTIPSTFGGIGSHRRSTLSLNIPPVSHYSNHRRQITYDFPPFDPYGYDDVNNGDENEPAMTVSDNEDIPAPTPSRAESLAQISGTLKASNIGRRSPTF